MNKLFVSCIFFFNICLIAAFSLNAAQNPAFISHSTSAEPIVSCAPELKKHFQALLKIPEARAIIEKVRHEGSFQITIASSGLAQRFGAFWDMDRRIICVDASSAQTEGEVIGSLLFELHNASITSQFDRLDEMAASKQITKEYYVESMEYLEYLNSLSAAKIATKGIRMGVLPADAVLPTFPSFKEHFRVQKSSGHSACFERNFDMCLETH